MRALHDTALLFLLEDVDHFLHGGGALFEHGHLIVGQPDFVDFFDAARAELESAGIEYLEGAQGDVVQIWISDPNGQVIELQQSR